MKVTSITFGLKYVYKINRKSENLIIFKCIFTFGWLSQKLRCWILLSCFAIYMMQWNALLVYHILMYDFTTLILGKHRGIWSTVLIDIETPFHTHTHTHTDIHSKKKKSETSLVISFSARQRSGKTPVYATIKWYNLYLQIIQIQIMLSSF